MKILVVQDRLRSGGTERQSILLARAFRAAGHEAHLLTFRPGGALASTAADLAPRALQPFDIHLDWFAPGLISAARQAAPDIILCMGRMANCYAGSLQRAVPRAAVVATMRTGKNLPWLFRRSLQRVTHVVANSHAARAHLVAAHRIAAEKIDVIHNSLVFPADPTGRATSERSAVAGALRASYQATDATTVLVNVAMFRPEKNQRELIALAASLPTAPAWQLWLAGDGPERMACVRLAASLKLGGRVRFLNFQRDPAPLYAAADVAVHASTSESLSNFLIEAQAHGLPAVAYAAQGVDECFIPGQTGWAIPSGNRADFHSALIPLFTASAEERARRSAAARAYARSTFDTARQVTAYLELFEQLRTTAP